MPLPGNSPRTLVAARMYYVEERTQAEIAHHLGVSRPTVSRLLRQARADGIVQIRIVDPSEVASDLGSVVAEATGARRVVVVPGHVDDPIARRQRLGAAAARVVEETVRDGDKVGIGWGRTLRSAAEALREVTPLRVTCVPLLGGLGRIAPAFQVHDITTTVARALGGSALPLYLPAIVADDDVRHQLLESPDAALVLSEWAHLTTALVGIGNVAFDSEMQMLFGRYLDASTQVRLGRWGAVGDICMRFYDRNGHPIADGLRGVIGLDLERLRRIPNVIAVAGGSEKSEAIIGALRGGYVDTLVTDEPTAQAIVAALERATPTRDPAG